MQYADRGFARTLEWPESQCLLFEELPGEVPRTSEVLILFVPADVARIRREKLMSTYRENVETQMLQVLAVS